MTIAILENNNGIYFSIGLIANIIFFITIILGLRYAIQVKDIDTYSINVLGLNILANFLILIYGLGTRQHIASVLGLMFMLYYIALLFMKIVLRRDLTFRESVDKYYRENIKPIIDRIRGRQN